MRKVLVSFLMLSLLFHACEKDEAPSVWMRFTVNGVTYEMKGKNAVYYPEGEMWREETTYISAIFEIKNYRDSMSIHYPMISFTLPGKTTGNFTEQDMQMLVLQMEGGDLYGKLYFGEDTISLNTTFTCTLTENSEKYCAGTFSGTLYNADGDSAVIENGDFRVMFYDLSQLGK